jgi:hypothetical protein
MTSVDTLIEIEKKLIEVALLAVPVGPALKRVLDDYVSIAAEHDVPIVVDPKATEE